VGSRGGFAWENAEGADSSRLAQSNREDKGNRDFIWGKENS